MLSGFTSGDKGKQKVTDVSSSDYSDSSDASTSASESEDESSSESDEEITQEYLDRLLQQARQNAATAEAEQIPSLQDDEILTLDDVEPPPLPQLNPGTLPTSYIQLGEGRGTGGILVYDPDTETEEAEKKSKQQQTSVAPPLPPPELTKSGKPLTKKERKESKNQTAGPDWFDMPAPAESELPRLHREYEAMRLRNQLDPKRFYRKDEGEGKGTKGLPKYFAIGKIAATGSPFGNSSGDNLPRSQRKRTLVDELVDDAEAKRYAKKKFNELQAVRGARGKNTLRVKQALRKPKW